MFRSKLLAWTAAVFASVGLAAIGTAARADPPSSTPLAPDGTSTESIQINSPGVKFQTKGPTSVRVSSFTWGANSDSGWHSHPGVLLALVVTGTVTVWDKDCNQTTYGPNEMFVEGDNELMKATSASGATELIWHVVPQGSPFRVNAAAPACATSSTFRVPPKAR